MSTGSKKLILLLTAAAFFFVGTTFAGLISKYFLGHDYVFGLIRLLDVSSEQNIPTWFSSAMLLYAAILLWRIAAQAASRGDRGVAHWKGLSLIFLWLSMDETASIHELVGYFFRTHVPTGGVFYYSWVFFFGLPLVLAVAVAYLGFFKRLPAKTQRRFFLAAFLYVAGSLGMEVVGGVVDFAGQKDTFLYAVCGITEEVFEMGGAIAFLNALIRYGEEGS